MTRDDDQLAIVCGPEMIVEREVPQGQRWCFVCRARRNFVLRVCAPRVDADDAVALGAMWGPVASIACAGGHVDGDLFPGGSREWA